MSLSRSFFLAGCPSLLAGLWRADEESTAEIMLNFNKNLIAGNTKDVALQKTKLTYCDIAGLSKNRESSRQFQQKIVLYVLRICLLTF